MNTHAFRTYPVILSVALASALAWAVSPHFIRASGSITSEGGYLASFKEAGLGTNQNVHFVLSAGAGTQFTYQCYTRSNNQPRGAPNNVFPSSLTSEGTFNSGQNGQITNSLTLTPQPTSDCQGQGLKLCLVYVNYQEVTLTDTTNNVSTSLPSLSYTFLDSRNRPTNCEPF